MTEMMIETRNLTKKYRGTRAVDALNLAIPRGEIYGFLGPNGAGKTTTIRMLLGLIKPDSGVVQIFGQDLRKDRLRILRRVGSLVEYPSYYGHLNAIENLETSRRILNVPKSRIDEVLHTVGLTKDAKRHVKGYSLGMKQRLGIASALLGSPELLILDEPTNGLDPSGILEIRELIKRMPQEQGITVLVSSHLLSEVEQMASSVGIVNQGRMIFQDTIPNLQRKAGSEIHIALSDAETAMITARELGCFPRLDQGKLVFKGIDNDQIARLVTALVDARHSIYRVEERRKSLEDLFLTMTGGGSSDAASADDTIASGAPRAAGLRREAAQ
ncbi:ABC transporter ATP-binding protein [Saccharibacillus alkalitolerans]|uniref:ABC transporter ATP-binding protein n=1 Tax=Saccharibacillus alkalitolerans TaxID=2705290 RepID=A0ABX0FBJ3_9BACL|nr:ATP-binding cassette domain-containing protein [Saccharibacillus alkalitolerans]NGZ77340.1 ABC transporter ATP-binding protein [Saccharibacillus alkalitolerans]